MSFDPLAGDYDRLRSGEGWREITEHSLEALRGATRLLDVGCGTGRFAVLAADRLGCRTWAVDPAMLEQARARPGGGSVGWRRAVGERLPFRAGWFDAGHVHLVMHLVSDRSAVVSELARVVAPSGRLAIVTFELDHFDEFHLTPYFPSIPAIDRARFPDPADLVAEVSAAGFHGVAARRVSSVVEVPAEVALERARSRYISTLWEVDAVEYAAGIERLEHDVAAGRPAFQQRHEWCLISARRGSR